MRNNLTGEIFGKLTVTGYAGIRNKNSYWNCDCECGNSVVICRTALHSQKSCGCLVSPSLIGKRFGKLVVVSLDRKSKGTTYWKCQCDCGKMTVVRRSHLSDNGTKTCGCIRQGKNSPNWTGVGDLTGSYFQRIQYIALRRKHDFEVSADYLWNLFCVQHGRCAISGEDICLPKNNYELYGHRSASLDRIDSTKGYLVDNVQWVHMTINMMKQQLPQQEFVDLCERIVGFSTGIIGRQEAICCERLTKDGRPGGSNHGLWRGVGDLSKSLYTMIIASAKTRGIIFDLDIDYLWELFEKQDHTCALSGLSLVLPRRSDASGNASLDRIDSLGGYIVGNVQWVHKKVNFMKQQLIQEDFIATCQKITEYQKHLYPSVKDRQKAQKSGCQ